MKWKYIYLFVYSLLLTLFLSNVEARFGTKSVVPSYIQQKRIFSNILKKDNEKGPGEISNMHYPHHVKVLLTSHLPTLYPASYFYGEVTQDPQLEEDPPCVYPSNPTPDSL